jgi:hypothetical protein
MPMKTYEVELKRVSYVTYIVQALDETDAECEAWNLVEQRDGRDTNDATWEVEYVSEYEE